jgi:ADP-heptose:LPS heptosyltransferase
LYGKVFRFNLDVRISVKYLIQKLLSKITNGILKFFNIYIIYRIGHAVGDQLCMSSVIKLINEQYPFKIVVISSFSELFNNNPRLWKNYEVKVNYTGSLLARILRFLSGDRLENFLFTNKNITYEDYMRKNASQLHLAQANTLHFNIDIDFNQITNEIYLSKQEIKAYKSKFNLPDSYSLIQPNAKISYTPNKQWGYHNYQKVITQLNLINWVQVGVEGDLLLNDVINFVGVTSLRELAFLLKNADFVLSDEGLLNHMASAVDSKSYVVFSGFSQTELAHYDTTISIVNNPQVECSPCWITDNCPKKIKYCTEKISVKQVVNELK